VPSLMTYMLIYEFSLNGPRRRNFLYRHAFLLFVSLCRSSVSLSVELSIPSLKNHQNLFGRCGGVIAKRQDSESLSLCPPESFTRILKLF